MRSRRHSSRVADRQVLISIGLIDHESTEHFDRAVTLIEPMIEGIIWD
jgi:hypothetical protein